MAKTLLVTGGAGFIGSHTLLELISDGYIPVVFDNFSNSSIQSVRRVEELSGAKIEVITGDITSPYDLEKAFDLIETQFGGVSAVVHFAGLKAVGESVNNPISYYANNVSGTIELLRIMDARKVRQIVFSSSATVYGSPAQLPCTELSPIAPTNPYGWTKAHVERILIDWARTGGGRTAINLRYFNPIGSHPSGLLGEDPKDIPNNLFPFITQVAIGRREFLSIYGSDYQTPDGTGARDYIHVVDLAAGHVAALRYAEKHEGASCFNLGTGRPTTVLQMLTAFEEATGVSIPYKIVQRRDGDVDTLYADPSNAATKLGWTANKSVQDMCADGWRWQSANPNGFV